MWLVTWGQGSWQFKWLATYIYNYHIVGYILTKNFNKRFDVNFGSCIPKDNIFQTVALWYV